MNRKQRGGGEKTERQHFKKETSGQTGGGGRLHSEEGSIILLEPGEGAVAHTYTLKADIYM